ELARSIALSESADLGVERLSADVLMNFLAQGAPAVDRSLQPEAFDALDGAVEGDPRHNLRIGEVPPPAAHFPDAFVGVCPDLLEMIEKRPLHRPARLGAAETA